jgi:RNA polymerase sigma factor (sigma-70 family)
MHQPPDEAELRRLPLAEQFLRLLGKEAARAGATRHLTPAEEVALAQRARRGDRPAEERLIASCVGMALKHARRHVSATRGATSMLDCVQEGIFAVRRAIQTFDPRRGPFRPYARTCLIHAQRRWTAESTRVVRLPARARQWAAQYEDVFWRLHSEQGRPPSPDELATALRIPRWGAWRAPKPGRPGTPGKPGRQWHPKAWDLGNLESLVREQRVPFDAVEDANDDPYDGTAKAAHDTAAAESLEASIPLGEVTGELRADREAYQALSEALEPPPLDGLLARHDEWLRRIQAERLRAEIKRLAAPQADVIHDRYYRDLPLAEIGRQRNVSRQRVKQIHDAGLRSLRDVLTGEPLFEDRTYRRRR